MSSNAAAWPVLPGAYQVGEPDGPVAICALTSQGLITPLAKLPGVAIAGNVYTANHGIERIVINVTANPAIRFLLLCGKEAALFRPGQSLAALAERGADADGRIIGAAGYEPVLPTVTGERVAHFRRQVELIDWTGEEDESALEECIRGLVARSPGRFTALEEGITPAPEERFTVIRPGGQREPLQYDPKGYFIISLDREQEEILLRHYTPDHAPAHEMRGRSAGPMLLGLLREGLVTQLSHAGYLGEELAKAQIALRAGWRYDQDRPLRPPDSGTTGPGEQQGSAMPASPTQTSSTQDSAPAAPPRMASVSPAMTWAQAWATAPGAALDAVIAVTHLPAPDQLAGDFLEPDAADPFSAFHRTPERLTVRWTPATRLAMGGAEDLREGALVRARGMLGEDRTLDAQALVILTRVARIIEKQPVGRALECEP